MGYTIAEKILGRASRAGAPVHAGAEVEVKPDHVLGYDFPGYLDLIFRQMKEEFGIERVAEPERFALFIDHMVPATTPAEEELHIVTRTWCADNGVKLHEREGIGHQVAAEAGYAVPGGFVVHFDGHIAQLGAFGTLAIGIHTQLLEAFVRERIDFSRARDHAGEPDRHARPRRDGARRVPPSGARSGSPLLPLPGAGAGRAGASRYLAGRAPDHHRPRHVHRRADRDLQPGPPRARLRTRPCGPGPSRRRRATRMRPTRPCTRSDLSDLAPIVVVPPNPAATADLADHAGLAVQAGYLGSCASGRLEDLRAAAAVLKGRRIAAGFQLHIVPTSQAIMAAAAREGLLTTLIEAGAFVTSSSCDYCYGRIATMTEGQRAVSTGTLNVRGRMGSPDSEIYLCNAAAVAASALEGRIADPRPYLSEVAEAAEAVEAGA